MADSRDVPSDKGPLRRRASVKSPWLAVGLGFAVLTLLGINAAAHYLADQDAEGTKPPVAEPKDNPRPAPVNPESKRLAFQEAWAKACEAVEGLEADEQAQTAEAMKALTAAEKNEVEQILKLTPAGSMPDAKSIQRLQDLNMYPWLITRSARLAVDDADCRRVAEAFWDQQRPVESCLYVMQLWFTEDAATWEHAIRAVRLNTPAGELTPAARKAVIALGGQKWLER